jgi:hypothetical protein
MIAASAGSMGIKVVASESEISEIKKSAAPAGGDKKVADKKAPAGGDKKVAPAASDKKAAPAAGDKKAPSAADKPDATKKK